MPGHTKVRDWADERELAKQTEREQLPQKRPQAEKRLGCQTEKLFPGRHSSAVPKAMAGSVK